MNLAQRTHWNLFDQLQHDVNREHAYKAKNEDNVVASDWAPAVDIKEEKNKFLLIADIPGVHSDNIEIQMDKNILSIKGERNTELKNDHAEFNRIERKHGVFYRRFTLPESINAEGIEAKCENGVLTLSIPKLEVVKPRTITVN